MPQTDGTPGTAPGAAASKGLGPAGLEPGRLPACLQSIIGLAAPPDAKRVMADEGATDTVTRNCTPSRMMDEEET